MEFVPWTTQQSRICEKLLKKHNIDILNLQETEIKTDVPLKILHIPGYSIEVESNKDKRRVATYVSNRMKYRRRHDLERETILWEITSY